MARLTFPSTFLWGAATAAYQIEGSPLADGAAPSIWHEWSHTPGKIVDGTNGDVACDHFRLWRDDIRHMKDMGLTAYRFSVSWPRIFPEAGRLNHKGLDFYSRLVDGLREAGIEPWVTLFHWDTPVWLQRLGGFTRRLAVDHLVEFGSAMFKANAVLPMEGRPAMMISSPGCRPEVMPSRSWKPVATPVMRARPDLWPKR